MTDARGLFEARAIAWTYFDWWGHFGLVIGPPGARVVDADIQAFVLGKPPAGTGGAR